MTTNRNNKLTFSEDTRGLIVSLGKLLLALSYIAHSLKRIRGIVIHNVFFLLPQACVDAGRNRLGVCCIDKFKVINGRRKVRQDDVLKVQLQFPLTSSISLFPGI